MADPSAYELFCVFIVRVPDASLPMTLHAVMSAADGRVEALSITDWWKQWQALRRELKLAGVVLG